MSDEDSDFPYGTPLDGCRCECHDMCSCDWTLSLGSWKCHRHARHCEECERTEETT